MSEHTRLLRNLPSNFQGLSPRGLPYKKERVAHRKFWKESLRGTKIVFCGRDLLKLQL